MKRKHRIIWSVIAIVMLPLLGYASTYGLAIFEPLSDHAPLYQGAFTLILIFVLLAVPYGMLKLLGHAAHIQNPAEKELRLKDVAKDQEQLNQTQS